MILYEMLTGHLPFTGEHEAAVIASILNDNPTPVADLRSDIPLEIEQIVARTLHRKQDSRYSSCESLLQDLQKVLSALRTGQTRRFTALAVKKALRKPRVGIPIGLGCLLVLFLGIRGVQQLADIRYARVMLLPAIKEQFDAGKFVSAYRLALQAKQAIPEEPELAALWDGLTYPLTFTTDPPGAETYIREYTALDSAWIPLGQTPIDSVRLPLGAIVCSLACDGYEPRETMIHWFYSGRVNVDFEHQLPRSQPEGMIYIPANNIPPFLIDRHEVTNQEYLKFVRDRGYEDQTYWTEPFIRNGMVLDWEEVVSTFTDEGGNRLGPANWKSGTYPIGQEDFPVSGINWFEAAAYAEYAGKALPTSTHWAESAFLNRYGSVDQTIADASNMYGGGVAAVGSRTGIGFYGLRDMAGNVREWCLNESGDLRIVRGGSYQDPSYMYQMADVASPFDRSLNTGFRCMQYLAIDDSTREVLEAPVPPPAQSAVSWPDSVPNQVYQTFLDFFRYDPKEIEADTVDVEISHFWRMHKVSFPAAYGDNEQMSVFVFSPKGMEPPFKTVVYWPGAEAIVKQSSKGNLQTNLIEFFVTKGNRAVVYPVLKGTYERGNGRVRRDKTTIDYRDWMVDCIRDLRRTVDYIVSEPTFFDTTSIAYYGLSWGSAVGPIALAVESRLTSGIFLSAGFYPDDVINPVNAVHYASRVDVPVLMLMGRNDLSFPYDTSQQRMFDLLGSSVVCWRAFPSGHISPHWDPIIDLCLRWLDDPVAVVNDVQGQEGFRVRK